MAAKVVSERARRVHDEAIVIDMEVGPIGMAMTWPKQDLAFFKQAVDAGVSAMQLTIPESSAIPEVTDDFAGAVKQIVRFRKAVKDSPYAKLARTAADIHDAKKEGKIGLLLGLQDAIPYERDLELIEFFHDLGVTVTQPAYFRQSYLCAGCAETVDNGLTDQGKKAVKEMNRVGMLIDVSHVGDKSAMDIIELSTAPIGITHSTPSTLVELSRARSDEVIKAACEKGGVIGQIVFRIFCERRGRLGVRPTLDDYVEIVDYLVGLVGIDHVGMATDATPFFEKKDYELWFSLGAYGSMFLPHQPAPFEERMCEGWDSVSDTINITEALLRHGYSDDDTKKVMGGNWLRLIGEVCR